MALNMACVAGMVGAPGGISGRLPAQSCDGDHKLESGGRSYQPPRSAMAFPGTDATTVPVFCRSRRLSFSIPLGLL